MPPTRSKFLRLLRLIITMTALALIVSYIAWRSLSYARGPLVSVFEPVSGSSIATSTVTILGRADRISSLSLNGFAISVDQEGNFKQTIVIFPGVNVITIDAADKFGRKTRTEVRVFGAMGLVEDR